MQKYVKSKTFSKQKNMLRAHENVCFGKTKYRKIPSKLLLLARTVSTIVGRANIRSLLDPT